MNRSTEAAAPSRPHEELQQHKERVADKLQGLVTTIDKIPGILHADSKQASTSPAVPGGRGRHCLHMLLLHGRCMGHRPCTRRTCNVNLAPLWDADRACQPGAAVTRGWRLPDQGGAPHVRAKHTETPTNQPPHQQDQPSTRSATRHGALRKPHKFKGPQRSAKREPRATLPCLHCAAGWPACNSGISAMLTNQTRCCPPLALPNWRGLPQILGLLPADLSAYDQELDELTQRCGRVTPAEWLLQSCLDHGAGVRRPAGPRLVGEFGAPKDLSYPATAGGCAA
jgi:hypothetical protein